MDNKQQTFKIPVSGTLGLLALGHKGVIAWKKVRDEHLKNEQDSTTDSKP